MTVLCKATVVVSDDPRYTAGQTYDLVLSTSTTPDPAQVMSGTLDTASAPPAISEEVATA